MNNEINRGQNSRSCKNMNDVEKNFLQDNGFEDIQETDIADNEMSTTRGHILMEWPGLVSIKDN